ncbi:MAG: sigma-70 family RNA polymerase sigma factor [Pseudonocardiaceae bacterium]
MGDPRSADARTTALALAAGAGDRAALTAFIRATQRDVYRFLCHLCDRGEAEDLTQDTYLRALRALPSFAGRSCARTWLLSIARRVAADQIRRTSTRPRTTPVEDWDTVVAASLTRRRSGFDEGILLRQLVAALEPDRRDAFVLTQMLGLDYAATAEVCGCPIGTIRSRVARAREDLIRAMNAPGVPGCGATGPALVASGDWPAHGRPRRGR